MHVSRTRARVCVCVRACVCTGVQRNALENGVVCSTTRREWMFKLNRPITGAIKGEVYGVGTVEDSKNDR